ncbi:MAG TPA: TonB-dependent receptor, partial [Sphingobacteriaceae bacterium]
MNGLWKILSVVLLVLIQTSLHAQTNYSVSGVIKDARSGESLIGVSVRFTGKAEIGTGTNAYGFYSARLAPGDYTMTVSYVGYKTLTRMIRLSANQRFDLALEQNNVLSEVVISGERRNENVSDAQMGLAKINLAEVKNVPVLFGERDVLKTIQLLPGIKPAGEGNSGFYVRGGSSDHNLILLDEATVYNASHLLGFFSTFNSDAIKDVAVYKGGMPAEYGGRLASVLDIKMNDGNRKDHTAEGGIGLISSRLKVEGPLVKDKSSFMVSGRRTYADAFLALSSDSTINDNTIYFYDLNAKVNFQINDKNVLYLSGYFGRDELGLARTFAFDWGNSTATLRWSSMVNSRLFSGTSLIYSNYDYSIENFLEENGFRVRSGIRNFNLKQDFQYTAGSRHDLKFGINAIHHTIMPGHIDSDESSSVNNIAIENRKGLEIAAYVSDEWELNSRLRLVYGLRFSDFLSLGPGLFRSYDAEGNTVSSREYGDFEVVKNYLTPEPRISVSYTVDPTSSVKASYTRNSQNLHLMSNSTATSPTDLYIMNSNTVKPEVA